MKKATAKVKEMKKNAPKSPTKKTKSLEEIAPNEFGRIEDDAQDD